ncbi:cytochrome-c peroxidase [Hymenobacter gummosus]|uniref:Methylamine utilization protein MauG n=1 Tax=Hymenobacter gummosus TaxID=1776032 RepID=A0A431TVK2_9BACT|nr:cytochrome c peroxidase [Hymenobacter gummosus]RTQ45419.1 cytochrome-c peroxidase [Hymenobacter gummosus]
MLSTSTLRRFWPVLPLSLLLLGCKPDKDVAEAFGDPTPLTLPRPAGWPALQPMPADNPLTEEGVALGRELFYEKQLSIDGTVSCGSCHQQSKAFTDGRARALGVNNQQHTRNTMSLANLAWQADFTWDGANTELEQQARVPIENPIEMHQTLAASVTKLEKISKYPQLFGKAFGSSTITEAGILKALAQFERTLVSSDSKFDKWRRGETVLTQEEVLGLNLFRHNSTRSAECEHCHTVEGAQFAGPRHTFFNNGLDPGPFTDRGRGGITGQTIDMGTFKAPSLRNVALTAPYMHDGRFQNLEQVLDHYSDHVQLNSPNLDPQLGTPVSLTAVEKRRIIAFLHTLTDTTFTKDPRFSEPRP